MNVNLTLRPFRVNLAAFSNVLHVILSLPIKSSQFKISKACSNSLKASFNQKHKEAITIKHIHYKNTIKT